MWVCRRTPCSRAMSAVRRIRSSLTEKGAQGASATRVRAPGRGSWCSRISRRQSARMVASSWQHSSGGRPPWLRPRLIEPRVGWKRRPSSRAAAISTSMKPVWPRGKRYRWSVEVVQPVSSSSAKPTRTAASTAWRSQPTQTS